VKQSIRKIAKSGNFYIGLGSIITVQSLFGFGMNYQPHIEELLYLSNINTSQVSSSNIGELYHTRIMYRSLFMAGTGAGILTLLYGLTKNLIERFAPSKLQDTKEQIKRIDAHHIEPAQPVNKPLPKEMADEIESLDEASNKPDSGWISEIYQHVLGDEQERRK